MPVPQVSNSTVRNMADDERAAMLALYQKHNPNKAGEVDALLAKYKGKEVAMWSALACKYGADAIDEAKVTAAAAGKATEIADAIETTAVAANKGIGNGSEDVDTDEATEAAAAALRPAAKALFEKFAAACSAAPDLDKHAFGELVRQLCVEGIDTGHNFAVPSSKDLDAAFALADEDLSGTVDFKEFQHLWALVGAGHVNGLAGGFGIAPANQRATATTFKAALGAKRAEANRVKVHVELGENAPEAEAIAHRAMHEREFMSSQLTKAHEDYNHRDHHTVAKDMGHLAQATEASKHAHDKHTADNTSEAEMIAYQQVHGREETSKALSKAHAEWDKRDHAGTKTDTLGHFATATAASKHHHDQAHDADHEPEGEHIAYMRTHERELMSQQLALEKAAWEQREHATVADKLGHFATGTEASMHHHDKHTSDNTAEAEMIQYQRVHARAEMSKALAQDHAAWQKRSATMRAQAVARFKALDADGNGSLDLSEVLAGAALLNLTDAQARSWFHELDVDGSGDVDVNEFLARSARHTEAQVTTCWLFC